MLLSPQLPERHTPLFRFPGEHIYTRNSKFAGNIFFTRAAKWIKAFPHRDIHKTDRTQDVH